MKYILTAVIASFNEINDSVGRPWRCEHYFEIISNDACAAAKLPLTYLFCRQISSYFVVICVTGLSVPLATVQEENNRTLAENESTVPCPLECICLSSKQVRYRES